jgi:hypothetical protein
MINASIIADSITADGHRITTMELEYPRLVHSGDITEIPSQMASEGKTFTCTRCGESKKDGDFPHAKGKRHSWCRKCNNSTKMEARHKFRETHPRKKRITSDCLDEHGLITCSKCGKPNNPDHYQNNSAGWCKACKRDSARQVRRTKGVVERKFSVVIDGAKLCMCCEQMKNLSEFYPSSRGAAGVSAYCSACTIEKYRDPEKSRLSTAKYRVVNRERYLATHRLTVFNRKSKIKVTADKSVTAEFLKELYGQEFCYYCLQYTVPEQRTVDHKDALSRGGLHTAKNLVMACRHCNCSKRDLSEDEFMNRRVSK